MIDRSSIRIKSIGVRITEADLARLQTLAEVQGRPMGVVAGILAGDGRVPRISVSPSRSAVGTSVLCAGSSVGRGPLASLDFEHGIPRQWQIVTTG